MTDHPYEAFLDRIQNPSQYLGGEINAVVKKKEDIHCRLALCFPEVYGIGMSNLGMKLLYAQVNREERLWAERFFAPEPDMEEMIREEGQTLRSLESHDPLSAFDIAGFSISTELCFTEILAMLDLGGVPLYAAERDDNAPLVIGGGASVYNPEPMAPFFDLFVLGEAEFLLPEICLTVGRMKREGKGKADILRELAEKKGVYVPSFFNVEYDGLTISGVHKTDERLPDPERLYLEHLGDSPYPYDMVIPYGQPVFDRLAVEVDRGCTVGCRYCQAGTTYRPVRERKPEQVMEIVGKGLKATGYDEVSLASLSSGDYSHIKPLVKKLMDDTSGSNISLSLPSLRSGTLTEDVIEQIGRQRQTGFTITAEAGSERLRKVINKKVPDEEIYETARKVLAAGWKNLKLYFMTGLPTETEEDIDAIIDMVRAIDGMKENGNRFSKINVGVSQFVPKAFTPFQWAGMEEMKSLLEKKKKLLYAFKKIKAANLKGHGVEMSFLEGVFSRGDRRLAPVVETAYKLGCRLDGWTDHFRFDLWEQAFEQSGVDPKAYAYRECGTDEILPWDHLKVGVTKKFLKREWDFALKEKETHDCRYDNCLGCGLPKDCRDLAETLPKLEQAAVESLADAPDRTWHYRIAFKKAGLARYLSHLEFKTAVTRAGRRVGLPVAYSQGMHPHPKYSFGPAVSVGMESLKEFIDVELTTEIDTGHFKDALNKNLETGLEVVGISPLLPPYMSIQEATRRTYFTLSLPSGRKADAETIQEGLTAQGILVELKEEGGEVILDMETPSPGILGKIRKIIPEFGLGDGVRLVKKDVFMVQPAVPVAG